MARFSLFSGDEGIALVNLTFERVWPSTLWYPQEEQGRKTRCKTVGPVPIPLFIDPSLAHNLFAGKNDVKMAQHFLSCSVWEKK